jgi:membrane associated rhomboid family serine protease
MFALWMFGRRIEAYWGTKRFVIYYFVCVIGAALVNLFVLALQGRPSLTLGASGGVFGILLAYGMMFPNNRVVLLIPPIPMKAKWFVILYGVLELSFGVTGIGPSIAHFAHLGGMLFGFLLIQYWRRRWPFGFRSRTK